MALEITEKTSFRPEDVDSDTKKEADKARSKQYQELDNSREKFQSLEPEEIKKIQNFEDLKEESRKYITAVKEFLHSKETSFYPKFIEIPPHLRITYKNILKKKQLKIYQVSSLKKILMQI